MVDCSHSRLIFEPSQHARSVKFKSQPRQQRQDARRLSSEASNAIQDALERSLSGAELDSTTFPGPLVLPDDELSYDPAYSPQSLRSCVNIRNPVTDRRRTIYVAQPPSISSAVAHVRGWSQSRTGREGPAGTKGSDEKTAAPAIPAPDADDVMAYLKAFYHPLPVKLLPLHNLQFVPWEPNSRSEMVQYVGLRIGAESIRIRARESPDGIFSGQLNLNDLLDAAMAILPGDAFALLMFVHHDIYEDEEDDFCCGRAYGGSRVAVISTARYNPGLDEHQGVEREHAWPASHCWSYIDARCVEAGGRPKKKSTRPPASKEKHSAIRAAVTAFSSLPAPSTVDELSVLWLSRFCKTVSHELGHCFGIDHCVYYACIMQGTAGLSEDVRQPPYLCPVDLAKVITSTGANVNERYGALLRFCEKFEDRDRTFAAFAAWIRQRITVTNEME